MDYHGQLGSGRLAVRGGSTNLSRRPIPLGQIPQGLRAHPVCGPVPGEFGTGRGRRNGVSRLIIWRHGQTAWNADDRIQGHVDVPLDDVGRAQAAAAAGRIAEEHPDAMITGGVVFHGGRLYVPVSSLEEGTAAMAAYECCTFRGSVLALDASSGKLIWTFDPKAQLRAADAVAWDRHRGVALWKGKVYVGVADGRLIVATWLSATPPICPARFSKRAVSH